MTAHSPRAESASLWRFGAVSIYGAFGPAQRLLFIFVVLAFMCANAPFTVFAALGCVLTVVVGAAFGSTQRLVVEFIQVVLASVLTLPAQTQSAIAIRTIRGLLARGTTLRVLKEDGLGWGRDGTKGEVRETNYSQNAKDKSGYRFLAHD